MKNQAIADQMLSAAELDFLKTYAELRFRYYRDNVLKHFAKHFRDFRELEFYLGKNEGDKKEKSLFV